MPEKNLTVASEIKSMIATNAADVSDEYIRQSKATNTRRAYAGAWRLFLEFCEQTSSDFDPPSYGTLKAWIGHLGSTGQGRDGQVGRSPQTARLYVQGVASVLRTRGHDIDLRHPLISATLAGLSRSSPRVIKKAAPVDGFLLERLVAGMGPDTLDVRDKAILLFGWHMAARRSEIASMDWQSIGDGDGFTAVSESGITITLLRDKTIKDGVAREIFIPRAVAPETVGAVEAWARVADLHDGQPMFQRIRRHGVITGQRLSDRSIDKIIRQRVVAYARSIGKTTEEVEAMRKAFSGHSLRAGVVTEAVEKSIPIHEIRRISRHKSDSVLLGYARSVEDRLRSPLAKIGR